MYTGYEIDRCRPSMRDISVIDKDFFHLFQMSGEFICKICEVTCTGKAPFDQHLQSAKHIKKAQMNPVSPSSSQPITRSLSSTTTNISEDSSITSTYISPETMRVLLEWDHPRGYKPYCDICHITLHGGSNADLHFQSNNSLHHQKLAAWKTIQEGDAHYSCAVCSERFDNENLMREHFSSDPHRTMVEAKILLKKFILIYQTFEKLKQVRRENSSPNDDLPNMFDNMKIIDKTEQKSKAKQTGLFSQDKLQEIMNRRVIKDDDDD